MLDLYIKNVKNYAHSNSKELHDYRVNDITSIKVIQSVNQTQIQSDISFYNDHLVNLRYDLKNPQLKFIIDERAVIELKPYETKYELLKSLIDYAFIKGYFEPNNGSHICLKFNKELFGYLRLSGEEFYKIHPFKELFFSNFNNFNQIYTVDT